MSDKQFPCLDCGAHLLFVPGSSNLECPYCGAQNEIPKDLEATVDENCLQKAILELETQIDSGDAGEEIHEIDCDTCGASFQIDPKVKAGECPYCTTTFVQEAHARQVLCPGALLPFKVTQQEAHPLFKSWVASRWFAPSKLNEFARTHEKLKGVYLAHWTYDGRATTHYTGSRGEHYWVNESYTDSEGNRRTKRVRKTRWHSCSGSVQNRFDDILVVANNSLPRKYSEALEPWDLQNLVPFEKSYLSGFSAETYCVGLKDGFDIAEDKADPTIKRSVRRDIGGDEQRIHQTRNSWYETSYKYVLLPVWILSYQYEQKVYRILINARTGEVQGERPYSYWKIAFAALAGIAAVALIAFLISRA